MDLELPSGTARFSQSCGRRGFVPEPYDWHGARSKALVPTTRVDIRTQEGCDQVLRRLEQKPPVVAVLVATPCETGSRARELPMPQELLDAGLPEARPLRSEQEPWGLRSILEGGPEAARERAQLESANALWAFSAALIRRASQLGILWVLENPWRSLLWWIPEVRALLDLPGARDVILQHCMFGGDRDKKSRFRTCTRALDQLGRLCDGSHPPWRPGFLHRPYGGGSWRGSGLAFATSAEAAYPQGLCDALAEGIAQELGVAPLPQRSRPSGREGAAEAATASRSQVQGSASADAPVPAGTPAGGSGRLGCLLYTSPSPRD